MCGIVGRLSYGTSAARALDLSSIAHRGPDSHGDWEDENKRCWLGHTRLAILDTSDAGNQPMESRDGRYVIVFNGEIYNHRKLRAQMPEVTWRSESDTGTILQLFNQRGMDMCAYLKGMFALAIYDRDQSTLFAARDRFGIKPLYYRHTPSILEFSSEVRILEGDRALNLSSSAVANYLAYGHLPGVGHLGEGIFSLPPGCYMTANNEGKLSIEKYWIAGENPMNSREQPTSVEKKVHDLVETSVREHLLSDVPVASFLSGGIDSSVVTLLAGREMG